MRAKLESSLSEHRTALASAHQELSTSAAEVASLTKRLAAAEARLGAREGELRDLAAQNMELKTTRAHQERAAASDISQLSLEHQVPVAIATTVHSLCAVPCCAVQSCSCV
jgi:chromosome segregation ATPase